MRTIITETTLYSADELRQYHLAGFERAHTEWQDSWPHDDSYECADAIAYTTSVRLGSNPLDYIGKPNRIPGTYLYVTGWDLGRGSSVEIEGRLERSQAPNLPWPDDAYLLIVGRDARDYVGSRILWFEDDEYSWTEGVRTDNESVEAFWQAWDDVLATALSGGREWLECAHSEQSFLDAAESNDWEFTKDGELWWKG